MKFVAEADSLTIEFEGVERFFAFKHRLVLPRKDITSLVWTSNFVNKDRKLRVGGTGLPWLLAGRFRDIDTKELLFLYISRPQLLSLLTGSFSTRNVLVVTMSNGKYTQVLVTCQPEIGQQLAGWWGV